MVVEHPIITSDRIRIKPPSVEEQWRIAMNDDETYADGREYYVAKEASQQ